MYILHARRCEDIRSYDNLQLGNLGKAGSRVVLVEEGLRRSDEGELRKERFARRDGNLTAKSQPSIS